MNLVSNLNVEINIYIYKQTLFIRFIIINLYNNMITIKFNDIIQFIEIYFLLLFVNVIGFNVQLNRCELKFCINGIVLILTAVRNT